MTDSDQIIITATMLGYMAGLADREHANPYSHMQTEAWSWQHGYEQGRMHRARSEIRDAPKQRNPGLIEFLQSPKPSTAMENLVNWMARRMHERNHLRTHEWAKQQLSDTSTQTPNTMTKLEAIQQAKQFRKDADELLQRMKRHKQLMTVQIAPHEERFADDVGECIAQHTLSIRDLESCIMRQGMALKNIGNENPYPNSYDPTSKVVDPTADNLRL